MKVGRNERCPCGSGLKVKRCCGVEAVRERAQLAAEAGGELFVLATHFPRYRPATAAFEAWVEHAPEAPSPAAVEAGLAALDTAERARIVDGFARDYPDVWASALADFGDDELAAEFVLAGAVVAGVAERRRSIDVTVELLEFDPELQEDPALALSLALDPYDVWNVIESAIASDTLDPDSDDDAALEAAAERMLDRLTTPWHEQRLGAMVARLRARIADGGHVGTAGATLAAATDRFGTDAAFRRRVAALLLLDSFDRIYAAAA